MAENRKFAFLEESGAFTGQHQYVRELDLLSVSVVVDISGDLTLTDAHHGKVVRHTTDDDITITAPAGLRSDFRCSLLQWDTGTVTVAAGTGATVSEPDDQLLLEGQYVLASLIAVAQDTFLLTGRTAAE